MNICVLAEDFYPTEAGGAITDWKFARFAAQEGHNVTVITKPVDDAPKTETVDGVQIRRVGPSEKWNGHERSIGGFLLRVLFSLLLCSSVFLEARKTSPDVF